MDKHVLVLSVTSNDSGTFYKHGLTLIPAWISNQIPSKVWGEIIYAFLYFKGCTVEVQEWVSIFIPHFKVVAITF